MTGSDKKSKETRQYDHFSMWMTLAGLVCSGGLAVWGGRKIYIRFLERIPNGDHVTPNMFEKKRWIKGIVTSVGDADGFRFFHTPRLWFSKVPTTLKGLKGQTISIRIAGADAPEGAHFGREAQPFAAESHAWLKRRILRKKVSCQLLHRDQYSRIVANVKCRRHWWHIRASNLAIEMLHAGWATTYEQSAAQYGDEGKDAYIAAEKKAKAKRRGMWRHGTNIETPAEYKRKYAQPTETRSSAKPQDNSFTPSRRPSRQK